VQSRSKRTVDKWKKRIADLISPDAAKIIASAIPELRATLGVAVNTEVADTGLTSAEAVTRLKSVLGSMFQTFALKGKVHPHKVRLTFHSHVSLPWMTCNGHRLLFYVSFLTAGNGTQLLS
jgi:hypothetical protein